MRFPRQFAVKSVSCYSNPTRMLICMIVVLRLFDTLSILLKTTFPDTSEGVEGGSGVKVWSEGIDWAGLSFSPLRRIHFLATGLDNL